jgi:hypothetical protein
MPASFSEIGNYFKDNLIGTTGNVVKTIGDSAEVGTKVAHTAVKGSLKATDQVVGATAEATGRIGVASANAAATVGESGTKLAGTAALAISGTAETIYNTASTMKTMAAAKGNAIAEKSIAVNEAKTNAVKDPKNVEKMQEVADKERSLELTKNKYNIEQTSLREKARHETNIINEQINALKMNVKKSGALTEIQNSALIKASKAKSEVMNAEKAAEIIEKEAMNELKCRTVLETAGEKSSADEHDVLNNTVSQHRFCTNKKHCTSTGKVLSWYNVFGSNNTTCANIKQKYKTFEAMSKDNAGGRKTARKRLKRKKSMRRPKKNIKKTKKHSRRTRKNIRRPKKHTRKTKKHTRMSKKNIRRPKKHTRKTKKHTRMSKKNIRRPKKHTRKTKKHTRKSKR